MRPVPPAQLPVAPRRPQADLGPLLLPLSIAIAQTSSRTTSSTASRRRTSLTRTSARRAATPTLPRPTRRPTSSLSRWPTPRTVRCSLSLFLYTLGTALTFSFARRRHFAHRLSAHIGAVLLLDAPPALLPRTTVPNLVAVLYRCHVHRCASVYVILCCREQRECEQKA